MALPVSLLHTSEGHTNRLASAVTDTVRASSSSESGTSPSLMRSFFHFTADDAVILAMEHNNHSKLLAISTSKNELFVTSTRDMPLERTVTSNGEQPKWDVVENTQRIDHLRYPCTQLAWAPWQYGTYLACVCRGKQVRLYRFSHGIWSLDEVIVQDCNSVAFSVYFTMSCVTAKGEVSIYVQTTDNGKNIWSKHCTSSLEGDNYGMMREVDGYHRTMKGYNCAAWDETGSWLAMGNEEGVACIFSVSNEGRTIGGEVYTSEQLSDRRKGIQQVAWSPGAGRSFLVLAVVTSCKVTLLFFRCTRVGGSSNTSNIPHASMGMQLQLITKTSMGMEEVTELSWNSHGGSFVTAHTDGTICVWALSICYQRGQQGSLVDVENVMDGKNNNNNSNGGDGGVQHVTGSRTHQNLVLVASIRKVSGVHPYYGGK